MATYHDLANVLRSRIVTGEWGLGSKIPSISELQEQHRVHSLNTVRAAQQLLVEEGMLETRQGIGAFVVSATSLTNVDVRDELASVRDRLTTILAAMESRKPHHLTINLDDPAEPELPYVLIAALEEWVSQMRDRINNEPDVPSGVVERTEVAERLLQRVEDAL